MAGKGKKASKKEAKAVKAAPVVPVNTLPLKNGKKSAKGKAPGTVATQFKPGNPGGTGRPRGLRNAVSQAFLGDMLKVWNEKNAEGKHTGIQAIRDIAKDKPDKFVSAMGNLVPREIALDDEQAEGFMAIWQALAKASASKDE